jgi:hypothetical protein
VEKLDPIGDLPNLVSSFVSNVQELIGKEMNRALWIVY